MHLSNSSPAATTKGAMYPTAEGGLSVEFLCKLDLSPEGFSEVRVFSLSFNQLMTRFGGLIEAADTILGWILVLDYCTLWTGSELGYEVVETVTAYQEMLRKIDEANANNTQPEVH